MLDGHGLRWFVCGAHAVALRAAPRATQDLDVTVQVEGGSAGLRALTEALAAAGLRHRCPAMADELGVRGAGLPLTHASGMDVDLVIAGAGLELILLGGAARAAVEAPPMEKLQTLVAAAFGRATSVAVAGVEVPVAHATDLAVMKALAGRDQDLDDLRSLLAGGEVDRTEARALLYQLEEALGRSDLVPRLEAAGADLPPGEVTNRARSTTYLTNSSAASDRPRRR